MSYKRSKIDQRTFSARTLRIPIAVENCKVLCWDCTSTKTVCWFRLLTQKSTDSKYLHVAIEVWRESVSPFRFAGTFSPSQFINRIHPIRWASVILKTLSTPHARTLSASDPYRPITISESLVADSLSRLRSSLFLELFPSPSGFISFRLKLKINIIF